MNTFGPATPEKVNAVGHVEAAPNTLSNPETPTKSPERAQSVERSPVDNVNNMPPPTPVPIASNPPMVSSQTVTTPSTPPSTNPVSASDGNVIEKEWIEKVKQVIASTSDNPHAQQKEISRLMADYVLKRTGRKIGKDGGM